MLAFRIIVDVVVVSVAVAVIILQLLFCIQYCFVKIVVIIIAIWYYCIVVGISVIWECLWYLTRFYTMGISRVFLYVYKQAKSKQTNKQISETIRKDQCQYTKQFNDSNSNSIYTQSIPFQSVYTCLYVCHVCS